MGLVFSEELDSERKVREQMRKRRRERRVPLVAKSVDGSRMVWRRHSV